MKQICLIAFWLLFGLFAQSQNPIKIEDKVFNWGAKVGLNSTFPVINSITVNGEQAENIHLQYRVGFLAAAFWRVNIDRFFIQPSVSWRYSSGDIRFNLPEEKMATTAVSNVYDRLVYKTRSIEAPVLVGYKIVNDYPYGLSLMAGPNFKYNYDVNYSSDIYNSPRKYTSDSTPWGINIVGGVGVTIWRFFFDVTYEFGLNQVDSDFRDTSVDEPQGNNIVIDKRTNVLSFSLGFLF
ncbi:hypothetical protein M2459_002197 [Parabacteroides sp. PF5-5]|uniref:porin family protein n=1 Tax=unclassified Parabacteroides TaxID=2649774 RepID=UPI00247600B4|nr:MULTISPECIES: porin family protein [unclassified Parabacteroides]MDH6305100.1 hypothetical protein [Parabacteroides sp. PH5-39]MDH6316450.1 hypothetical protein [Parabacteroides sp. PF5-13]MDH6319960.1 hypothetical protein [Parabacteroides sp. PH5-13]MDH6323807.1 hypothetical protein [Parabacteroides sp. PH5-8]MDH6327637.1 hypothetical protein [Parabacteroides sp. PH5-41]